MSKTNQYEVDILALLLQGVAIANVADNASSSPLTGLHVALHTADPGEEGDQGTDEADYTGYSRVAVTRSTAGFVVSSGTTDGASASPVSAITFGQATSTSTSTITHFSIGATSDTTDGRIFYSGTVTPNISIGNGVTPRLTTGSSIRED